jgi:hypothetical protein
MPIGTCKSCRGSVSTNAPTCPHCGAPWPTKNALNKPRSAVGCFLVVFLILGILFFAVRLGFC